MVSHCPVNKFVEKFFLKLTFLPNGLCRLLIFSKINFFEKFFLENTIIVSNSFDPDQARRFVGPDLGSNNLQRLSADDKSFRYQGKQVTVDYDIVVIAFIVQINKENTFKQF